MFVPAAAYAADIQAEIGRMPTDAVLSLDILFGAALGAAASDVPFAFLSPHVSLRTLPGMPPATWPVCQHGKRRYLSSLPSATSMSACPPILLQKSFCVTEYKFSGPYARRSNNHSPQAG